MKEQKKKSPPAKPGAAPPTILHADLNDDMVSLGSDGPWGGGMA